MSVCRAVFNSFAKFSDANNSLDLLINFSRLLGLPIPFRDGETSVNSSFYFIKVFSIASGAKWNHLEGF